MFVWLCLIIYIFIARAYVGTLNEKNTNTFLFITGFGIIFIMGSRYPQYEIVYDLEIYYKYYETVRYIPWKQLFSYTRFEPGYAILNKILSTLIPWNQFILYFEAAFCVICTFRFIKKNTSDVFLGVLSYVLLGSMAFQLTAFRQALAMSICLISIEYAKRKKLKSFIFLVLLAMSFHITSLIFLPAYYFINRKANLRSNFISIVIIIISPFLANFITNLGNKLFNMSYSGYMGNTLAGLVPIAIYSMIIIYNYLHISKSTNRIGLNMLIPGLAIYIMRYATTTLERISHYYTIGVSTALPEALELAPNLKFYKLLKALAVILMISLFIYRLTYAEYAEYRFFWN